MTYRKLPHKNKDRFIVHNGDLFSIHLATHKQKDKATFDPMMLEILQRPLHMETIYKHLRRVGAHPHINNVYKHSTTVAASRRVPELK